jgi:hypothetical protein
MDKVFHPIAGQVYVPVGFSGNRPTFTYTRLFISNVVNTHVFRSKTHCTAINNKRKAENISELLEPKKLILIFNYIFSIE